MKQRNSENSLKQLLQEWHSEIIALVLVLVAILLFLGLDISGIIVNSLQSILRGIAALFLSSSELFTLRNLFAFVLMVTALTMLAKRIRYRLIRTPKFVLKQCPVCGSSLSRQHRHTLGHIVSHYIPVGRYSCQRCSWIGWRILVQ